MATDGSDAGDDITVPGSEEEELPWPVGFIILVSLAALYVGWRIIQLLVRAVDSIF